MIDRNPLSIKDFGGLDWRGTDRIIGETLSRTIQGETPFDKALDIQNLIFLKNGGIRTRDGFEIYIKGENVPVGFTINGQVSGFWKINDLNGVAQTDRWLILSYNTSSGNGFLYDTGADGVTTINPVLTVAGMKYAFVINAFGRMYISPWEAWAQPLGDTAGGGANNVVWLYNGKYNARKAAGGPLTVGTFAVAAAAGGNCTPGVHLVSVLAETDSGFITAVPIGHSGAPLTVTTTAANATMNFTNIPVGAAGTGIIKRHIIVTKVVVNNNGQGLLGYEPFFAVTINDNTTTTSNFTKPDSALVDSAKIYANENLHNSIIRSYVAMAPYGSRMVYLGSRNSGTAPFVYLLHNSVAISPPNRPEEIGRAAVPIEDVNVTFIGANFSGAVMTGTEINNTFYIFKEDSTFSVDDNPDEDPASWPVNLVDAGKGAFPFAVASIADNPSGLIADGAIVLGHHGISFFNGRHSQVNISENIWDRFAFDSLLDAQWSQILIDPVRKIAFWKIGDPLFSSKTYIYTIDYKKGFDPETVKFGRWQHGSWGLTPAFPWLALREGYTSGTVGATNVFDVHYPLLVCPFNLGTSSTTANTLYLVSEASVTGDGQTTNPSLSRAIDWYLETGYTPNDDGELYQFSAIRVRGVTRYVSTFNTPGNPYITLEYGVLDDTTLNKITLNDDLILGNTFVAGNVPKKFETRKMNAKHEQIRIKVSGSNRTFLSQLILFGRRAAEDRPRA